jgi:hypothetical protein
MPVPVAVSIYTVTKKLLRDGGHGIGSVISHHKDHRTGNMCGETRYSELSMTAYEGLI